MQNGSAAINFAVIEPWLEAIYDRLARLPSCDLAKAGPGIIFARMMLTTLSSLFFLLTHHGWDIRTPMTAIIAEAYRRAISV